MANLLTAIKTNFFHVKEEGKFREIMSRVYGEKEIVMYENKDPNGNTIFAFGSEGRISGIKDSIDDDCNSWPDEYVEFIDSLQSCVAEDDAIIMVEIGAGENLRFVSGFATIITSSGDRLLSLKDAAQDAACKMLGNLNWAPLNEC